MKKAAAALILTLFFTPSFGQGMFGASGGLGLSTTDNAALTPAFNAYLLHKIIYRVYAGADLSLQRYSLLNTVKTGGPVSYGDIISVRQKSSYAFISAKVDYAIGYRKYIHFSLAFGPGIFVGGHQYTNTHLPYWTPVGGAPYGHDTVAVNTSYNIPNIIYRGAVSISERIPTRGYWNIMLSQEFSYLPGNLSKDGPALNTSYIAFHVGIMHKYPMVFVEY